MLEKGDLIKLSNNKEYLVINQLNYKSKSYVYLVTKDGVSGIAICEFKEDNFLPITDLKLFQKLLALFVKQEKLS